MNEVISHLEEELYTCELDGEEESLYAQQLKKTIEILKEESQ